MDSHDYKLYQGHIERCNNLVLVHVYSYSIDSRRKEGLETPIIIVADACHGRKIYKAMN